MKTKIVPPSGNVFRDLGFSREEAEHLRIRSILMLHVQDIVRGLRLRQRQTAKILGVTQPRVSDLLRGRSDLFSTDTLIDMLPRLGGRVKLLVKKSRKNLNVATRHLQRASGGASPSRVCRTPSGAGDSSAAPP